MRHNETVASMSDNTVEGAPGRRKRFADSYGLVLLLLVISYFCDAALGDSTWGLVIVVFVLAAATWLALRLPGAAPTHARRPGSDPAAVPRRRRVASRRAGQRRSRDDRGDLPDPRHRRAYRHRLAPLPQHGPVGRDLPRGRLCLPAHRPALRDALRPDRPHQRPPVLCADERDDRDE